MQDIRLCFRRQGWNIVEYKPRFGNKEILYFFPSTPDSMYFSNPLGFYKEFGDKSLRKILKSIFKEPRTQIELSSNCSSTSRLNEILVYLQNGGLVVLNDSVYQKGPKWESMSDIGKTLEWYVAEWFIQELQVPACYGARIKEVSGGGDIDVVAFVEGIRVMVECKSGNPQQITDTDIKWFMQRVYEFNPEIAIFLVDTDSSIDFLVNRLNTIYHDIAWQDTILGVPSMSAQPQPQPPQIYEKIRAKGVFWCTRNIYMVYVPKSIDASISGVLRTYFSEVRHLSFLSSNNIWDFVKGKVQKPK